MSETSNNHFTREQLVQSIKEAGQDVINRAEEIAQGELISDLKVILHFDPTFSMLHPTIEINREHLCKATFDRITKGGE